MYVPQTPYTQVASDSIRSELNLPDSGESVIDEIPDEFYSQRKACFVSLHLPDGELRGCIGTIYPQEKNLYAEISRNAISAAFRDSRFSPLKRKEFDTIEISVDVLTVPEEIESLDDLDPHIFGVIVADDRNHKSVLLPGLEGIESVEKQLEIARRKAGICNKTTWQELRILRFTSNRYH